MPPDYSFSIGLSVNACEGGSILFDAGSPVATSYQWYQNNNTIAGATNSTYLASTAGSYKAIAYNSCGSDTTPNNVLAFVPNPIVQIISSVDTVCVGEGVTLVGSGGLTYAWQSTANLSSATGDTITASSGSSFDVIVQGTDFGGCSANDTVSVTVLPTPVAAFTFTQSGTTVNTTNTSSGAMLYDWNFGDGATDISNSPSHTYASTGVFTVQLIATNSNGCADTTTQTIDLLNGINPIDNGLIIFSYNNESEQLLVAGDHTAYYSILIFDVAGRKIISDSFSNNKIISLQTVTPGIYFALITVGNQGKTIKLIVN